MDHRTSLALEPLPQSQWPAGYWDLVDAKRDDLALGRVPPIGAHLADADKEDI
jgi:hypothetical protein